MVENPINSDIKLQKGAVDTIRGVFQSFSYVGPAADVAILLLGTVEFSLVATPLAIIVAWLIYGLWMITPYEFSKFKANAGSYYAYSAGATPAGTLGPFALFSWMGENFTGQSFGILGVAGFIFAISSYISGIPYLWIGFAVIITLYMFILPYLGIKISTNYMAITGIMELLVLLIGSIIIIIKLGVHNTIVPFEFPAGAIGSFFFGVVFSIVDFTGLGTVTTLSEEVRNSKKKVKKSLVIAWLLAGLALIPASYALVTGWGLSSIGSYASSADPGLVVFRQYLGPAGFILLIIFTINSYFSYGVSKTNAVSRIWYSGARDGVIYPKFMARLHPKHKTPGNVMMVWLGVSFVLDLILGLIYGPTNAGLVLLTMSGIAIIVVHIVSNTSLTLFSRNYLKKTGESNFLLHYVAPTVASILGLIVIYFTVESNIATYISQPTAINLAYMVIVIFSVLWVVIGATAVTLYYKFKKPNVIAKAGVYDAEVAE
ncbi:MAG: amino acid permease [Thermoplasmataceae archaeon]|jgi:amino acid transporter